MSDMKILLTADLNIPQSVKDINAAIEIIQSKIVKLKLEIDTQALKDANVIIDMLKGKTNSANKSMKDAAQAAARAGKEVSNNKTAELKKVENAIRRVNDEIAKSETKKYTVQKDKNNDIVGATVTQTNEIGRTIQTKLGWVVKETEKGFERSFEVVGKTFSEDIVKNNRAMDSVLNKARTLRQNLQLGKNVIFDKAELDKLIAGYSGIEHQITSVQKNGHRMSEDVLNNLKQQLAKNQEITAELQKQQKMQIRQSNKLGDKNIGQFTGAVSYENEKSILNAVQQAMQKDLGKLIKPEDIALKSVKLDKDTGKNLATLTVQAEDGKNKFRQYTVTVDQASAAINRFGGELRTTANRNLDFGTKFRKAMESIPVWMAGMTAFYQTLHFFTDGISYVNEFNKALTELSIVFMQSQDQVAKYGETFHQIGMEMGISTEEIAKGAVEFARQGLNYQDTLERMRQATIYAKISNISFADSAKIITATVNSMNVDVNRAIDVFSYMGDATATGKISNLLFVSVPPMQAIA